MSEAQKISELFGQGGPVVSFEFFPPKTAEGVEALYRTAEALGACRPSCFFRSELIFLNFEFLNF